ncbi:MAG: efflux RND transporter permease subunit [Pirellulaceae bacterium]
MKQRTFFGRFAIPILILVGGLAPFIVYAAGRTVRSNSNRVQDWLPKSFVETGDLAYFREHFLSDQFVLISWEGCKLGGNPADPNAEPDDPRIEKLTRALTPESSAGEGEGAPASKVHYFKAVTTGRDLMDQLTTPPMDLSYAEALKRLQGLVIGPDGRQTCVIATLTDEATTHFRELIGRGDTRLLKSRHKPGLLFNLLEECGIAKDTVHLGGPPVDNVAIDEEGERTLIRLALLSGLFGLFLAWWSLKSVKLTLIVVFGCGLLSGALALAAVWLTGQTADAVLMSMPSLVYVLAISGAVHLINYYREEVDERGVEGAPERALKLGWKPTCLCSVTTAIGLLSLCVSDLTPIRKFGAYSALGIMLVLLVLFVYLPAALQIWPIKRREPTAEQEDKPAQKKAAALTKHEHFHGMLDAFWQRFGRWVIRYNGWVSTVSLIVIAIFAAGVYRVNTSIDLLKLFDGEARILKDYRWLEENVGRLVPMEIVIRFREGARLRGDRQRPDDPRYTLVDRVAVISQIQSLIEERFGEKGEQVIGPSLSAATFVPRLSNERRGTSAVVRRTVTNSLLQQSYEQLIKTGYLQVDPEDNSELWRISLRVAAFQDVDYGHFADEVRALVVPVTEHYSNAWPKGQKPMVSAIFTGVVPIVYKAQRALLDSLVQSTVWSFLTITPLLMFVCRGVGNGLVAMIPNVLPILVVFGGMAWLNYPVTIGSMMAASIALGVAVDDTIHYLTWFRQDLKENRDRKIAILTAYRRCGTPTLQAALINGLGLSVFAVSTFTPTREFGLLMLTILLAGGVAELIMMPALLAGPLGTVFEPRPSRAASFWAALRGTSGSPVRRMVAGGEN